MARRRGVTGEPLWGCRPPDFSLHSCPVSGTVSIGTRWRARRRHRHARGVVHYTNGIGVGLRGLRWSTAFTSPRAPACPFMEVVDVADPPWRKRDGSVALTSSCVPSWTQTATYDGLHGSQAIWPIRWLDFPMHVADLVEVGIYRARGAFGELVMASSGKLSASLRIMIGGKSHHKMPHGQDAARR